MTYTSLIVQADADEDGKARIVLAAGIARHFGALLIGVAARDIMPPVTTPLAGPLVVAALLATQEKHIREHLDAAEQQFWAIAAEPHQQCSWRSAIGDPAKTFARESRAADLLVVGRRPESASNQPFKHMNPGEVLMRAGRPVLVVPPGLSHLDAAHVVIAWKNSRTDASQEQTDVHSFVVLEPIADGFRNYNRKGHEAFAAELLLAAEQRGAELVVAGGYAHSRFQEWVFGSLTRALLGHFPKCCLLSH